MNRNFIAAIAAVTIGAAGAVAYAQGNNVNSPDTAARGNAQPSTTSGGMTSGSSNTGSMGSGSSSGTMNSGSTSTASSMPARADRN